MNKKICLLTDSLSSGGAEKMVANLSTSFTKRGYHVTVFSMKDEIDYSFDGKLFNFGKIKQQNNRFHAFLKFKKFFKKQNFDFVIDHRVRNNFFKELILSKLVFKKYKVIYCVHHFYLSLYFPVVKTPNLSKLTLVKNRKIIVVSKLIKQVLKKDLNLDSDVIYNYNLLNNNKQNITFSNSYIISVGRLEKVKQFDVLIKCYKNSKLPENNVYLFIYGEGDERNHLKNLIDELGLQNVVKLQGFENNIEKYISESKALVLSSKSEGFPMVLIEALALKTPIISFDCPSGPSEIVNHGKNGLLVKNQDVNELTKALNKMVLDKVFYSKLKKNINNSINPFSEETIIKKWINLLENF